MLHVGCADWPLFDVQNNLHLQLRNFAMRLDGCDTSAQGLSLLALHFSEGKYFTKLKDITEEYDVLLAPEVLEHVPNAYDFLKDVFAIRAKEIVITVPSFSYSSDSQLNGAEFTEFVHPDHYCWYSPATLRRTLADHVKGDVCVKYFLFNRRKTIGAHIKRRLR